MFIISDICPDEMEKMTNVVKGLGKIQTFDQRPYKAKIKQKKNNEKANDFV